MFADGEVEDECDSTILRRHTNCEKGNIERRLVVDEAVERVSRHGIEAIDDCMN